jgi:hypothetical protein
MSFQIPLLIAALMAGQLALAVNSSMEMLQKLFGVEFGEDLEIQIW